MTTRLTIFTGLDDYSKSFVLTDVPSSLVEDSRLWKSPTVREILSSVTGCDVRALVIKAMAYPTTPADFYSKEKFSFEFFSMADKERAEDL
mgnify:CR=1 FL=1|tara:strand:+ start:582 stop:854 length:273 start_codon:yes stop_codon:yes gene_type:complete